MGIGKRIKEARYNKGLTQEVLATMIGVTKGAIANYENETSHPKEPVMYALINALGVDANFLFQDCVEIKTPPPYSSEALEVARVYDTLDDGGKQRIREAVKREQDVIKEREAFQSSLIRRVQSTVPLEIYEEPIVGVEGIDLKRTKFECQLFPRPEKIPKKIPETIPLDQRETISRLQKNQARKLIGIRFRYSNQVQNELVFIVDQEEKAPEGELGLFTIDGKSYLGKVKDGQFFAYPEDSIPGLIPQNIKSEGAVIGPLDLKYIKKLLTDLIISL